MAALIVAFWFIAEGEALRFLVLFIGVMSCLYVIWDVIGALLFLLNLKSLLIRGFQTIRLPGK